VDEQPRAAAERGPTGTGCPAWAASPDRIRSVTRAEVSLPGPDLGCCGGGGYADETCVTAPAALRFHERFQQTGSVVFWFFLRKYLVCFVGEIFEQKYSGGEVC